MSGNVVAVSWPWSGSLLAAALLPFAAFLGPLALTLPLAVGKKNVGETVEGG